MPIHDVGYRSWRGRLTATSTRWWVIGEAGIKSALTSRWTRRALLAAWLPVLAGGIFFFTFEQANTQNAFFAAAPFDVTVDSEGDSVVNLPPELQEDMEEAFAEMRDEVPFASFRESVGWLPNFDTVADAMEEGDSRKIRNRVWSWLLMLFFRYPQGLMTLLLVGLVVPPLIARDVRSRAFLLYYSRPIGRLEYILGKLAVPASLLMLITVVPAMGLYCFGVMLSPNLSVVLDTWDIPVRVAIATAVGVVPTCIIALMFSSMTVESRFAGFAWFAMWGLGAVVWGAVWLVQNASTDDPNWLNYTSQWSLISLYSTIGRVQGWVFGLETNIWHTLPSMIVLASVTVLSLFWLYRRVSAPIRM